MDGESIVRKAYEAILNGDFEAAIAWFEEAIATDPTNGGVYYKCSITCVSGKWSKGRYTPTLQNRWIRSMRNIAIILE